MAKYSALAGRVIKVTLGDDVRRCKLCVGEDATPQEVHKAIKDNVVAVFDLPDGSAEALRLSYTDDEGDLCSLAPSTVDDWRLEMRPEGPLRLSARLVSEEARTADGAMEKQAERSASSVNDGPIGGAGGHSGAPPTSADAATAAGSGSASQDDGRNKGKGKSRCKGKRAWANKGAAKGCWGKGWCDGAAGQTGQAPPDEAELAVVRSALASKARCLDPQSRRFIVSMVQGMPAESLHGFLSMAAAMGPQAHGASARDDAEEVFASLQILRRLSPPALHAFAQDMLAELADEAPDAQGQGIPANDIFGALFGAKGMAFAAKGMGLGNFFAAKGKGKGKAWGSSDVPEEAAAATAAAAAAAAAAAPEEAAAAEAPTADAPEEAAPEVSEARATFERSVADLVDMGLAADAQIARQLLTEHGDIPSVVAILTGDDD